MVSVAVANQKGGVGKTTISVLLSRFLATRGFRTVLIDGDPQGHATGVSLPQDIFDERTGNLRGGIPRLLEDFLENGELSADRVKRSIFTVALSSGKFLDVVPNSIESHISEHKLLLAQTAPFFFRSLFSSFPERYDFCIVDCPPNLGSLFISALSAVKHVLIPVEVSLMSLLGLRILLNSVLNIKKTLNTSLDILGVILTKVSRTRTSRIIESRIKEEAGEVVFENTVPQSIRIQEAVEQGFCFEKEVSGKEALGKLKRVFVEFLERLGTA